MTTNSKMPLSLNDLYQKRINQNIGDMLSYSIPYSIKTRTVASTTLTRTNTTPTNNKIFTFATWFKKSSIGTSYQQLIGSSTLDGHIYFGDGTLAPLDTLVIQFGTSICSTPVILRDPSAWYSLVVMVDTTAATNQKIKMWLNGQIVPFTTYNEPALNSAMTMNSAGVNSIIMGGSTSAYLFDGYMSETIFVDGQNLTANSFGEFDGSGVWVPIKYSGTYGSNGFHLTYSNSSNLGLDISGNSNNWTVNNFVVSDQVLDSPSNNYSTWNVLDHNSTAALTNGALSISGTGHYMVRSTQQLPSSGLWYAEATTLINCTSTVTTGLGLAIASASLSGGEGVSGLWFIYSSGSLTIYNQTTALYPGSAAIAGSIYQIAYDATKNRAWVGYNNTWYDSSGGTTGNPSTGTNPTFSTLPTGLFFVADAPNNTLTSNFGQGDPNGNNNYTDSNGNGRFKYQPPTGFLSLCTNNMPKAVVVSPNKFFDVLTRNGTGASNTITTNLSPDLIWTKNRTSTTDQIMFDSVRGATNYLTIDSTSSETTDTNSLTSFNTNGFTIGTNSAINANAGPFVDWMWKAGGGTSITNTKGSIISSVSVNKSGGFSIITYTGTGSNGTIGHGLGTIPSLIILKQRNSSSNWGIYHISAGNTVSSFLNLADAQYTSSSYWNNASPTENTFSIGTAAGFNSSGGTYVAYVFASINGFSNFGSWSGNGSVDGPFGYTGFLTRFLMWKNTSVSSGWEIRDSGRNSYNPMTNMIAPHSNAIETSEAPVDFLSNGFKIRSTASTTNASGNNYIYAAFGQFPFGGSNISPTCAFGYTPPTT